MPTATIIKTTGSEVRVGDMHRDKKVTGVAPKKVLTEITYDDGTTFKIRMTDEAMVIRNLPTWADRIDTKRDQMISALRQVIVEVRNAQQGEGINDFKAMALAADEPYDVIKMLENANNYAIRAKIAFFMCILGERIDKYNAENPVDMSDPKLVLNYLPIVLSFYGGIRERKNRWSPPSSSCQSSNLVNMAEYEAMSRMTDRMCSILPEVKGLDREITEMVEAHKDEMDVVAD